MAPSSKKKSSSASFHQCVRKMVSYFCHYLSLFVTFVTLSLFATFCHLYLRSPSIYRSQLVETFSLSHFPPHPLPPSLPPSLQISLRFPLAQAKRRCGHLLARRHQEKEGKRVVDVSAASIAPYRRQPTPSTQHREKEEEEKEKSEWMMEKEEEEEEEVEKKEEKENDEEKEAAKEGGRRGGR